jgi:3-phenylpropionate/trans-cinnamate dioxygenase ferredoxin reductase component
VADRSVDILLIGGGIAAASCAETLRAESGDGSILLVGREPDPPYDRPPLSKGYLRGEETREDALLHPAAWWQEQGVELLTRTSVMKLDAGERTVRLSTREEITFDKALLATGANVRRLRVEGGDLEGIHYLRSFANSDAIRADADEAEHVLVVGGSFIACEVAATLTARGLRCTMVMQEDLAFERVFGRMAGGYFHGVLEERGIAVFPGDELEGFEGDGGRVRRARTVGGREVECECVVIGAGVVPDVMLARAAKLELGETGGVRCSAELETIADGVFAAGDVCEWDSPLHRRPVRVEHWDVAREHGRTAALNMLGNGVAHDAVPYFWSDLADWTSLEYVSRGDPAGDPVVRGSIEEGEFSAWWVDEDDGVVAVLSVGRPEDLAEGRRMIEEGAPVGPELLRDSDGGVRA